jgi:hypothetical protein
VKPTELTATAPCEPTDVALCPGGEAADLVLPTVETPTIKDSTGSTDS